MLVIPLVVAAGIPIKGEAGVHDSGARPRMSECCYPLFNLFYGPKLSGVVSGALGPYPTNPPLFYVMFCFFKCKYFSTFMLVNNNFLFNNNFCLYSAHYK